MIYKFSLGIINYRVQTVTDDFGPYLGLSLADEELEDMLELSEGGLWKLVFRFIGAGRGLLAVFLEFFIV